MEQQVHSPTSGWWKRLRVSRFAARLMAGYRAGSIPPDAIARAVSFAIGQPEDVDVNEIVVRPAAQR